MNSSCFQLQAHFLVLDDVMDGAVSRRGRPCWYRNGNIGLKAINDGVLLEAGIYQLLRKYFRDKPYYVNVLELFHDMSLKTAMGQCLDLHSATADSAPNFNKFTLDRYNSIVKYKTAYYSFQLPVALAMFMVSLILWDETFRILRTVVLE